MQFYNEKKDIKLFLLWNKEWCLWSQFGFGSPCIWARQASYPPCLGLAYLQRGRWKHLLWQWRGGDSRVVFGQSPDHRVTLLSQAWGRRSLEDEPCIHGAHNWWLLRKQMKFASLRPAIDSHSKASQATTNSGHHQLRAADEPQLQFALSKPHFCLIMWIQTSSSSSSKWLHSWPSSFCEQHSRRFNLLASSIWLKRRHFT